MGRKIIISLNSAWNIVNFRSGLIKALVSNGYDVIALAPDDKYASLIHELGCTYVPIKFSSTGINPIANLALFMRYLWIMYRVRPDAYLGFTIKPNIFGSLAAHFLGVPVINNVAGLGITFKKRGLLKQIVVNLYKAALFRSVHVFFQNSNDREIFDREGILKNTSSSILPGSGVNLEKFSFTPICENEKIKFLFVGRILKDKGVAELADAMRIVTKRVLNVECSLVGFIDEANKNYVSRSKISEWVDEGLISYLGESDDVRKEIGSVDCIVLPSYYPEGTPKSLLEAAAMGRAIITTDTPGCRDLVDHGVNGYLCQSQNVADLATQMEKFALSSHAERALMGLHGRKKAENRYSEKIVVDEYLSRLELLNWN
jgi:glycosyltransferase involved in cell wall biosynthesis